MLSHSASRTPVTSLSLDCAPAATARAGARSRQLRRHRLSSVRTASPSAPAACPAGLSWSGAAPAASACLCALLAWKLRCPGCLMLSSVCQVSYTEAPRVAPMQCRPSWLLSAGAKASRHGEPGSGQPLHCSASAQLAHPVRRHALFACYKVYTILR